MRQIKNVNNQHFLQNAPCGSENIQLNTISRMCDFDENISDFSKIPCSNNQCSSCVYISNDPRLVSAGHSGQRIPLDQKPATTFCGGAFVSFDEIECSNGFQLGAKNSYMDIKDGSIQYYYNKALSTPFIPQLFNSENRIIKESYIDPMGICKPHYILLQNVKEGCATCGTVLQTENNTPAWLRDSQFHREDLMSKQLWNRNQSSFEVNQNLSGELCYCK